MKKKKKQDLITQFADAIDTTGSDILPDGLVERAMEHKKLSSMLGAAYDLDLPEEKLAHLSTRVMARARASVEPGISVVPKITTAVSPGLTRPVSFTMSRPSNINCSMLS